jgi:hypothetical protein
LEPPEGITVQRRRSGRTLEALSVALGWHPRHLASVLLGLTPPAPNDPVDLAGDSVPASEDQLHEINKRLEEMHANLAAVIERASRDKLRAPGPAGGGGVSA